jgi:hypothetical protein
LKPKRPVGRCGKAAVVLAKLGMSPRLGWIGQAAQGCSWGGHNGLAKKENICFIIYVYKYIYFFLLTIKKSFLKQNEINLLSVIFILFFI